MTTELDLAIERLREHRRVILAMEHPMNSPYAHFEESSGGANLCEIAQSKDIGTLLTAVFAMIPWNAEACRQLGIEYVVPVNRAIQNGFSGRKAP